MRFPIYYVGSPAEVAHHARPLFDEFDVRIEDTDAVLRHAQPGDVCLFYNEFFPCYRLAIHELMRRQCATLYAYDGILEWRNLWDFPPGMSCLWTARPILCHKVACIGRSAARVFTAWGHADKCEVVGLPRLDGLRAQAMRKRAADDPYTILVLTAKCPGFNQQQLQRAIESLTDLKNYFEGNRRSGGVAMEPIWRITQGLADIVGVPNSLKDTTGEDLAEVLRRADAVVTTPSTTMLESMLTGVPVALLDYNNCPHYVPAAWRITAASHFDQVLPELLDPPPAKIVYQEHVLHDALECQSPALPRLVELIARMQSIAKQCLAEGKQLAFPPQMLENREEWPAAAESPLNYRQLYPANTDFAESDVYRLQAEVADLREAVSVRDRAIAERDAAERARLDRAKFSQRLGRLRHKVVRKFRHLFLRPKADEVVESRRAA